MTAPEPELQTGERRMLARALLADLVRPHRRAIAVVLLIVLVQVAATMAEPWLIGIAIDTSVPHALRGNYGSLAAVTIALAVSAALSGLLRSVFVIRSGAIGQAVLFDLRRRAFDHTQALSVSFHERFTSGRVISRLRAWSSCEKKGRELAGGSVWLGIIEMVRPSRSRAMRVSSVRSASCG